MQDSSKNWQRVFRCWIKIISTFLKIHYPYTLYSRVNKKSLIGSVSEFFFNRVPYVCARQFPQKVGRKRKGEGEKGKRKVKKKKEFKDGGRKRNRTGYTASSSTTYEIRDEVKVDRRLTGSTTHLPTKL